MRYKRVSTFVALVISLVLSVVNTVAAETVKMEKNSTLEAPVQARRKITKAKKSEAVLTNCELYQLGDNDIVLGLSGAFMPLPKISLYDENNNKNDVDPNEIKIVLENTRLSQKDTTNYVPATSIVMDIALRQSGSDVEITIQTSEPLKLRFMRGTAPANEYMVRMVTTTLKTREEIAVMSTQQKPLPPALPSPFGNTARMTLNLRDTELRDALRLMGSHLSKNIIIDPSLPTTLVTMEMNDVPMGEAFDYLAQTYGVAWRTMGNNTIIVGAKNSLAAREETRAFEVAYAGVESLPELLAKLAKIGPEKIIADSRTRTLYVTTTPEKFIDVANALQELDRPGRQILIQAKILEFSDGAQKEVETALNAVYDHWWMNYSGISGLRGGYADVNRLGRNLTWRNEDNQILPIHTDLTTPLQGLWREFDVAFQAVENKNQGQTLANPSLITIDGLEAKVTMTEDYPYISERDQAGNPTWSQQNIGPTLTFTPWIGRDGVITLKLNVSTGEVIEMITGSTGEQMPRTSTRTVDTTVRVRNGEPFVVGGLFRDNKSSSRIRIPILGHIPLLGELFTYRNDTHRKTQVVMLVVPYILDVPDIAVEQKMMAIS